MTIQLSDEIRAALAEHPDQPLTIEDARTHRSYVLISLEEFQKSQAVPYDVSPFDIEETYAAQSAVAGAAGWDDPEMDMYDKLAANPSPE